MYALQSDPEQGQRWRVLTAGAVFASLLHAAVFSAASTLERGPTPIAAQSVQMRIIQTQTPTSAVVEKPPLSQPKPEEPQATPKTDQLSRKANPGHVIPQPPPSTPAAQPGATEATAPLVVGLTLSSATSNPQGARFAVGTSLMGDPANNATTRHRASSAALSPAVSVDAGTFTTKPHVEAKLRKGSSPVYPAHAKREGVEGLVVLSIVINVRGQVESARVLQGLGYGLDESALSAVRQTVWDPATISGQPVTSKRRFNVRFTLKA